MLLAEQARLLQVTIPVLQHLQWQTNEVKLEIRHIHLSGGLTIKGTHLGI